MKAVDIAGQRFGRLVAIERVSSSEKGVVWRFVCDCGSDAFALAKAVRFGAKQSCGCLARDTWSERMKKLNHRHGMTGTPVWNSWSSMLDRCNNKNAPKYHHYGGRGIKVCERWAVFENFYAAMGDRPEGTTLDRCDANGHYEPGNCRWATHMEQRHNRRV